MPISRKSASIPKVRASSGIIGTTRWPISLFRNNRLSRRTKAIVVETSSLPLLLLMSNVPAFAGFAQPVALDRFGEDDRGLAFVFDCCFIGGIHFPGIVAAAIHPMQLFVGQMIDHLQQLGIRPKEMFANVAAAG